MNLLPLALGFRFPPSGYLFYPEDGGFDISIHQTSRRHISEDQCLVKLKVFEKNLLIKISELKRN
jgi:hypothetical protein